MAQPLHIGILGCRGIPNRYGGYEQFAEHLSRRLVRRGHRVTVYNSSRHPYREAFWEGVQLVRGFDPESQLGPFGQFIYDWNCLRDARRRGYDILLQLGYTSSAVWRRWWPSRAANIIHMDGLEWRRTKYRPVVRRFLRRMESVAARHGDWLIADSPVIQAYIEETYGRRPVFIPYGAEAVERSDDRHLQQFSVAPRKYLLAVSRLVPENNLEMMIRGHLATQSSHPLLIVGNTSTPFGQRLLRRYRCARVRFTEGIFEQPVLDALRKGALLYLHGHSVGGTNPSLLEAMACGAPICAHDNPFNRTVLGADAFFFETENQVKDNLLQAFRGAIPGEWPARNLRKIREQYSWERITDAYERLLRNALGEPTAESTPEFNCGTHSKCVSQWTFQVRSKDQKIHL
jgi:glycosyltransferase involved in cell wall biosynthesis